MELSDLFSGAIGLATPEFAEAAQDLAKALPPDSIWRSTTFQRSVGVLRGQLRSSARSLPATQAVAITALVKFLNLFTAAIIRGRRTRGESHLRYLAACNRSKRRAPANRARSPIPSNLAFSSHIRRISLLMPLPQPRYARRRLWTRSRSSTLTRRSLAVRRCSLVRGCRLMR